MERPLKYDSILFPLYSTCALVAMRRLHTRIRGDVMHIIPFIVPYGHTTNSACSSSDLSAISRGAPIKPVDRPTRTHFTSVPRNFWSIEYAICDLKLTTSAQCPSTIKFERTFRRLLRPRVGACLALVPSVSERVDLPDSSHLSRCRRWVVLRTSLPHTLLVRFRRVDQHSFHGTISVRGYVPSNQTTTTVNSSCLLEGSTFRQ
ncbi:hypothetical protein EDD17DRAFT_391573 [Pisolithus thermaeus]|nr:hypothetical protein EDD17DRAFT_391573 [Pisolithus thermaeus]